jgi:hypothetical protein
VVEGRPSETMRARPKNEIAVKRYILNGRKTSIKSNIASCSFRGSEEVERRKASRVVKGRTSDIQKKASEN